VGTREEADKSSRRSRARHDWQNRKRATGRPGEMFRSRAQPNEHRRQPQRWLKSHPRCVLRGGPRDIVDREERCDRDDGGRHPGEGHDLSMEMRLVDVAALRRHQGGPVTRGETVSRIVKADELGGALGGEADLGSEPGPQTFAAPSDLSRQPLDSNPPPASHHLPPGERDFGVDYPACVVTSSQRSLSDREPVIPRPGSAQLLLGSHGVAPPEVIEGDHRPAQLRRGAQDRVRDHRRQPHLEALEAAGQPPPSSAIGRESGDDAFSLLRTTPVVDNDRYVAEVEDHHDSRVRDQLNIDEGIRSIAEPCHGDPRQPTRP